MLDRIFLLFLASRLQVTLIANCIPANDVPVSRLNVKAVISGRFKEIQVRQQVTDGIGQCNELTDEKPLTVLWGISYLLV